MTKSIIAGACAAISLSMGADAGFTGCTVERVLTASGNTQYSVYANFDNVDLPPGKSWVFLNVYNYQGVAGSMNAIHQDAAEDIDGNPTSSWSASANLIGATPRTNDSWVTASGSGTSAGADASLDPSFDNTVFDRIVGSGGGAGWFDATPGAQNLVAAGGASGFRIKLIQIVRAGDDAAQGAYTGSFLITYKVQDTATPKTGSGNFVLIPAPSCAGGPDCNNNGCNDARDIFTGSSADINTNGVPDECEADCNNNDFPDRSEIAQGLVPDCNADQIPDDCQGAVRVELLSPNLGAPSGAQAAQHTFTGLRPAESGVTITVRASGDLSGQTEYIDPFLNGVPGARLFGPTGSDCPATPDVATLTLTREQFNTVLGSGTTLNLVLQSSAAVDPGECKGSGSLVAELKYFGIQPSGDCNGNQRLDVCEVYQGVSPDCNANLKPDSCDIASGFSADCNTNGIPDSCDIASGAADCNTNGVPDSCDVAAGTSPDIDANNKPDECQTVAVNAGGSIQAVITAAPSNEMRIINVAPGTYAGPINLLGKPIRLIGTGGAAVTTISGTGGQSQSVIRAISGEPAISLVKGFTVKGGTTGSPLPQNPLVVAGGGILMAASSTSIEACILEQNNAAFGGGAYLYQHAGSVTGCTVRQNTAQAYGGGIQLYDSSTTVSGCTFTGNNAVTAGGGLHIVRSTPSLVGCTISGNGSFDRGGGISWDPDLDPSLLTIQQCQITGNDADLLGSGLFIYPTGVASETQLIGTTICGNAGRNVVGAYQADTASQVCDCRADLNGDGIVNGVDLATILSNWGTASATADLSGDGTVSGADLSTVLAAWGTCPST
jgi:parallel beta-helix repeat protein